MRAPLFLIFKFCFLRGILVSLEQHLMPPRRCLTTLFWYISLNTSRWWSWIPHLLGYGINKDTDARLSKYVNTCVAQKIHSSEYYFLELIVRLVVIKNIFRHNCSIFNNHLNLLKFKILTCDRGSIRYFFEISSHEY